jgi:ADP-ribose pyrophosphatase YjhB (NUDIX family)
MATLIPGIRNAVRALIVVDDQLLLLRKDGGGQGERYALPGGAQDTGETLAEALIRECREEIDTPVRIGELLHVADYFKPRETDPPTQRQLLEFLFACALPEGYTPRNGFKPDKHQIDVVWMPVERVPDLDFSPTFLPKLLAGDTGFSGSVYLGMMR